MPKRSECFQLFFDPQIFDNSLSNNDDDSDDLNDNDVVKKYDCKNDVITFSSFSKSDQFTFSLITSY